MFKSFDYDLVHKPLFLSNNCINDLAVRIATLKAIL